MANYVNFICLANSRKKGGRCIAGINLRDGAWFRPVKAGCNILTVNDIKYKDNSLPTVLDIIKVRVIKEEPLYYQPENYIVNTEEYWEKIGELSKDKLELYQSNHSYILSNTKDYLTCDESREMNPHYSLLLIKPQNLSFIKTTNIRGDVQIRAHFAYKGNYYNLVVTDDSWENRYTDKKYGIYKEMNPENFFLTISLGSCFYGYHYKLVSAVII